MLYFVRSSSGYELGVPYSNRHVTYVNEGNAISSHLTYQSNYTNKHIHIGRLTVADLIELGSNFLKPQVLEGKGNDQNFLLYR